MKSTTFSRAGVMDSGAIVMSACPLARIGTFVSWLTATTSSLTPSRFAISFASSQAGPENCGPLPVVFSGNQGNSPIAAARNTPRFLISSTFALLPGSGAATCAKASGVHNAINASSATLRTFAEFHHIGSFLPRLVTPFSPEGIPDATDRLGARRNAAPSAIQRRVALPTREVAHVGIPFLALQLRVRRHERFAQRRAQRR